VGANRGFVASFESKTRTLIMEATSSAMSALFTYGMIDLVHHNESIERLGTVNVLI
jgi:hypothetical protein